MTEATRQAYLRRLPAVGAVLESPALAPAADGIPRPLLSEAAAEVVADLRRRILDARSEAELEALSLAPADVAAVVARRARSRLEPRLRRVVNATGIIVHTNLGRSVLAEPAVEALVRAARHYSNLELDLDTGERGERYAHVEGLLRELTGAEAALVVNNNAAAVLLALSGLARDREVVVSRGELVEIGGSFRIPDVMAQSGATLVEVGTTNKTRPADYERAITERTALLLKVHPSNYRIVGFTETVALEDLVALGRRHGLPVMEDLGSGLLADLSAYGVVSDEPLVRRRVAAGADLVTFSGDKLLGGPQAGVLVGSREAIGRLKAHPLTRALRVDKFTLAALEATLRLYLHEPQAVAAIPTLRMAALDPATLKRRARRLARKIRAAAGDRAEVTVVEAASQVGGGALPGENLPTRCVAVVPRGLSAAALEERLRAHRPPVMARIQKDRVLFDPRTLLSGEDGIVAAAVGAALAGGG